MRKLVRPAGTVSSAGSQVASLTVTAISPGTASCGARLAASQKAARPAAASAPAPASASVAARRESGCWPAMAQASLVRSGAGAAGRKKSQRLTPTTTAQASASPSAGASW